MAKPSNSKAINQIAQALHGLDVPLASKPEKEIFRILVGLGVMKEQGETPSMMIVRKKPRNGRRL